MKVKTILHHAHLFASDIYKSVEFYCDMFEAKVLFDLEMAGARNIMIAIGGAKINFYDQPPKDEGRGAIHHLGIETDDLEGLIKHMQSKGFKFIKKVKDLGVWKYIMVEGPDQVLLEIFEVIKEKMPEEQKNLITSLD